MAPEGPPVTVHLVPHTHYDVVWVLGHDDYMQVNARILRRALQMVRDRGFRFLLEQTYLLEEVERRYPRLFAGLKDAIGAGAMEIADGQFLMADTMLTHGEVIVRQILWGKGYAQKRFGVDVPVAWAADGFGLNAQMPQIYRRAGYKWVAFRRGVPRSLGRAASEFDWEGLDGSRILAHWMPRGYRAGLHPESWEETIPALAAKATTPHVLLPCGSGSTPPQPDIPDAVVAWNKAHPGLPIVIDTPRGFFEGVARHAPALAMHRGELYRPDLENVFQDVVTSRLGFKRLVRQLERELLLDERAATLAWLEGDEYPVGRLDGAWRVLLLCAFHDVVAGTCIDEVHAAVGLQIRRASEDLEGVAQGSFKHLTRDGSVGTAVMVFNPHPGPVKDWVEVEADLDDGWRGRPGIAFDGAPVASEVLQLERWDDGSPKRARLGFVADAPPMGYRLYELTRDAPEAAAPASRDDGWVETPFHRARLDPATGTLEVTDPEGRPLVEGNELVVDVEMGDLYFQRAPLDEPIARERDAERGPDGRPVFASFKPGPLSVRRGPLRTVLSYETTLYGMRWPYRIADRGGVILHRHPLMRATKEVVLHHDRPRIDMRTVLDHRCPNVCVKARFTVGLASPAWSRETQFGSSPLPAPEAPGEAVKIPCLGWVHAEGDGRGVGFFTRSAPFHVVRGAKVDLTLVRSVGVLSADGKSGPFVPVPDAQEPGVHTFEYAVFPHEGDRASADVPRRAEAYVQPLVARLMDTAPGARHVSLASLAPSNLLVTCWKRSGDGRGAMVRFYESEGRPTRARFRPPARIEAVHRADLLERPGEALAVVDGHVELDVGPYEIVTLRLTPSKAP